MAYVILQKGLEAPSIEQLKAAFRGVPGLTPADAAMMCKHSLGILIRGLGQEEARQIEARLAAQGIEVEVVDQATLPALPPMRHVTRLECTPDALMIYDPLGNPFPLEWKDIMLFAAGMVAMVEFKQVYTPAIIPEQDKGWTRVEKFLTIQTDAQGFILDRPFPEASYQTTEQHHERWMAEIVIRGAGLRYNLEAEAADQLLFHYLAERRTDDVTENFQLLAQDICQHAPQAAVNRGAYYLREGNAAAFAYPSKNAFYDEMIWLLWRLRVQS